MKHIEATATLKSADNQVKCEVRFILSVSDEDSENRTLSVLASHALAMLDGSDRKFSHCDAVEIHSVSP